MEHIPQPISGDGAYTLRAGDRIIYDCRNGTLFIHAQDGTDVQFNVAGQVLPRCFVGKDWSRAHTRAFAELMARTNGLRGDIAEVEGSFPTLFTFSLTM